MSHYIEGSSKTVFDFEPSCSSAIIVLPCILCDHGTGGNRPLRVLCYVNPAKKRVITKPSSSSEPRVFGSI